VATRYGAGTLGVAAYATPQARLAPDWLEVEAFLGADDHLNVFDLLHGYLYHRWAIHVPVRVVGVDENPVEVEVAASLPGLLGICFLGEAIEGAFMG
jgi:hypothetical protein